VKSSLIMSISDPLHKLLSFRIGLEIHL